MKRFSNPLPLILTLVFYLACLYLATGLDLDERVTALLPDSDPEVADFKTFITQVPAAEALYIQIDTDTPDPVLLAGAADAFYTAIKDEPLFSDILYRFSQESVLRLMDYVHQKKYRLLDSPDLAEARNLTAAAEMDSRLLGIKRQLVSPSGAFSSRSLAGDPFGLDTIVLKKLTAFQSEMPGARPGESRIISRNGKSLLMVASPKFPAVNTAKSTELFRRLNRERDRITQAFDHKVRIGFSGVHPATLDNSATIQSDIKRTILVLTIGILLMGILFFSRFYHVLLIFVPTLVSLALAGAAAALFLGQVSGIALGCGALLVGITVDFGIHILFHVDTLGTAHAGPIIRKLRGPVMTGAATTMAAFACLLFSSLPGQRQMGWISILGILGAAAFALTVLRYFITVRPWVPSPPRVSLVRFSTAMTAFRKKHISLLLLLCLALTIAGVAGLGRFTFEGDVAALNHLSPRAQDDMDRFLATWGQASPAVFMVEAPGIEPALEKNDALFRLLKTMEKEDLIEGIASLSDIFPSQAEQERRLQAFQNAFSVRKTAALEEELARACVRNGFAPDAFSSFTRELASISKGGAVSPITLEDVKPTVIYPLIKSKLIVKENRVMVLTTAKIEDKSMIPVVTERVKASLPGTLVIDKPYFIQKVTALVAKEFKGFVFWAALTMVLVLALFQRRVKVVAVTIIPVCLSALITAGLLGLAGVPVNLISVVFVIFVFGVGVDFSIFLVHHEMAGSPDSREITPGAVIICAMTTIGAFASLCFARHNALSSIGIAGLTGMTVSLLLALVIIPFLTERWHLTPGRHKEN